MFDSWRCHVCGKDRPDAQISVHSTTKYIGTIPVQQNVRYCNDNPACIEGARDVNFMTVGEIQTDANKDEWVVVGVFGRGRTFKVRRNSLAHRIHAKLFPEVAQSLDEEVDETATTSENRPDTAG